MKTSCAVAPRGAGKATMKNPGRILRAWATLLLLTAGPALAMDGECAVEFKGTSTLHDFAGQVAAEPFRVDAQRTADGAEAWSARLEVKAANLNTRQAGRDKNMRALLRAADHPLITGEISGMNPAAYRGAGEPPPLPIRLTLAGQGRDLSAAVKNIRETDREIRLDVEFPVSLAGFGLKPPSMLGLIRVGDRVDVICHLVLHKN